MGLEDSVSSYKLGFNLNVGTLLETLHITNKLSPGNNEVSTNSYGHIFGLSTGIITIVAASVALSYAANTAYHYLSN